jgi:co-chaperonin GroES (HSP10)
VLIGLFSADADNAALAQAPAAAPVATASVAQRGTVKAVAGSTLTLATDAGQTLAVNVAANAKVLQLAVGSTDLKTATAAQLSDIAVGDRLLAIGKAGDAVGSFNATRLVLMKSADIAQMQAQQQADWAARGVGGIVSAVDPSNGAITLAVGAKKLVVNTSAKTQFKRFSSASVKYEDAKPGTLADIQVKDQLQARGDKSADGGSITAEEVVSGSFQNLSGLLLSVDAATGKITLKDLETKKIVTVAVTSNADIRNLPLMMANRIAARSSGGGQAGGADGARRSAGADLAQMVARLPTSTFAELHKGDAVMIVASEPTPGASVLNAITVLTGVDPILTANPNGGMSLSMSLGGSGGGE